MALFSTLVEDWSSGYVDRTTKWINTYDPAGNPPADVVAGRGRVYAAPGAKYASIESQDIYTLTGSAMYLQVPTVAMVTAGSTGTVQTSMLIRSTAQDPGTRVGMSMRADLGTLRFESQTTYYDANATSATYDNTNMLWWRMRVASNQLYFETSATGTSGWATRRVIAQPTWMNGAADLRVTLESWRDNGTQDFAEFDGINTTTLGTTDTSAPVAGSTVTSNFWAYGGP